MVKAKKYIVQKQFDGLPKSTDLKIVEEELPPVKDGGSKNHLELFYFSNTIS